MSKNYTILGFGKSAKAALDFLLDCHAHEARNDSFGLRVYDSKPRADFDPRTLAEYEASGVEFEFGQSSLAGVSEECNSGHEFIVSPGIPPSSKIIKDLEKKGIDLKTDLDLFIEAIDREEKYIAVTGTNGKTTTTSLIAHLFNTEGIGNIGKPFLEFKNLPQKSHLPRYSRVSSSHLRQVNSLTGTQHISKDLSSVDPEPRTLESLADETFEAGSEILESPYVCEISSFQIFYSELRRLPDVAVYLNLTDDHLDWHSSLDEYKETKARLFRNSKEERISILNYDDKVTRELGGKLLKTHTTEHKSKVYFFSTQSVLDNLSPVSPISAYIKDSKLCIAIYLEPSQDPEFEGMVLSTEAGEYVLEIPILRLEELNIVGDHNYSNALAAILAAFSLKLHPEIIIERLKSFKAVPHRLEYVSEIDGHKFYNDSKATNPDSAIRALESFDKSIAIIGGKNKNLDLSSFLDIASTKCEAIIVIGELKQSIIGHLKKNNFKNIKEANSLEEAINLALGFGKGNSYPIVLTPASSSFDMFKSYEDRGDQFKDLVYNMTSAAHSSN